MASISRDPNGCRRILFVALDGSRKTIRLGKVSQRNAEAVKVRVEQLAGAKQTGHAPEADTAAWLATIDGTLADKLARVGLIPKPADRQAAKLGPFLTEYLTGRTDLKPATKIVRGHTVRDLNEFFGETHNVLDITPGDADDFKQYLIGRGLAPTTIHKRLQVARSFFLAMRRRKLIPENPFDGVRAAAAGIKDRQRFVTREEIALVLDACPDHHWRTIVALARYGGLRTPSETLSLRWQDIDWDAGRIVVTSPKTEHHAGKGTRTIPLFPELRPILDEAFTLAPVGAEFVVDPRFRRAAMRAACWINANLRTTFYKIVRRAGLTPWPRLFHNLRASRETELVEAYPLQVVTAWLGNTPTVAMRHYLMTTDAHFETAIRGSAQAAQNPAQQAHATGRMDTQRLSTAHEKPPEFPGVAVSCELVRTYGMAGFKQSSSATLRHRHCLYGCSPDGGHERPLSWRWTAPSWCARAGRTRCIPGPRRRDVHEAPSGAAVDNFRPARLRRSVAVRRGAMDDSAVA